MQKKWPKACPCVLWRFDWHRPDALRFILPTPSNFTTHLFGPAPVIIPQIQTFLDLIYTDFLNVSYWVSSLMRENRIKKLPFSFTGGFVPRKPIQSVNLNARQPMYGQNMRN